MISAERWAEIKALKEAGAQACKDGKTVFDNPHEKIGDAMWWDRGFTDEQQRYKKKGE